MVSQKSKLDSWFIIFLAFFSVLLLDNFNVSVISHVAIYLVVAGIFMDSILKPTIKSSKKTFCIIFYYTLLIWQIFVWISNEFNMQNRLLASGALILVLYAQYILMLKLDRHKLNPNMDETTLSFEDLRKSEKGMIQKFNTVKKVSGALTIASIKEILSDLPRHSCIRYVNKGSLSEEFLENMRATLDDENIYLILSDTGSTASNIIREITEQPYNHISISFDRDLKTLVSYNGGEKLSPPGLNAELIEWFFKKDDASIRIFKLNISKQQKIKMIEKIEQINKEGSAYNLLGLASREAFQPNIMFCSQFVCCLLEHADASYINKNPLLTTPTDLIELDYERKLEYLETIDFSSLATNKIAH